MLDDVTLKLTYCYKPLHPDDARQKAVSAHFTSEQILPFGFAERYGCYDRHRMTGSLRTIHHTGQRLGLNHVSDTPVTTSIQQNTPIYSGPCTILYHCVQHWPDPTPGSGARQTRAPRSGARQTRAPGRIDPGLPRAALAEISWP